jgi:hypothetical protein
MFNKERKTEICKQLHIKEIFIKFHEGKLFTRGKKVDNYKQALAIALSISNKQCKELKPIKKKVIKDFKYEDILRILKTKEIKKIIKTDTDIYHTELNGIYKKEDLYKKYLNKKLLFDKLLYFLSN